MQHPQVLCAAPVSAVELIPFVKHQGDGQGGGRTVVPERGGQQQPVPEISMNPLKEGWGQVLTPPGSEFVIGSFVITVHEVHEGIGDIITGVGIDMYPQALQVSPLTPDIVPLLGSELGEIAFKIGKIAVFPLLKNKPKLVKTAGEVFDLLKEKYVCEFDDNGNIGKRYRRQDEIGTPYCVTIDFDTIEKDNTVTVRNRDNMSQERIKIEKLEKYFAKKL